MDNHRYISTGLFIFFLLLHSVGVAQDPRLKPPEERRTLTILGSPNCPVRFNNSNSNGEHVEMFWGRIGYFDVNAKGEILVSACKEDANSSPQCQNLYKGNLNQLCEKEKDARRVNSGVRGTLAITGTFIRGVGIVASLMPNPNAVRKTTTGEKIAEAAIPGLADAKDIAAADCTTTLSLVEILHGKLVCKDGRKQNADLYCEEKPESECSFASAMSILSNVSHVN
jgi:hypothetical protein